ncbi:hypothetical protein BCR36DRAFT_372235 [Piromyces finnis]|uniref:Uncharacterized protein n=1 Tax=Piromyces finnis TaxID=1754191 RepID=A0A1Y1V3K2_9FUNG|nr:hypothetical protein BCR36DRAFT_372235 [Piromyces finnis]|eukprot:ORX46405.1 hypothetical protein BCR36DRAFT_372235 [Piromyces finnis]
MSSKCPDTKYSIPFYGCTSFIENSDKQEIEISLNKVIDFNDNINGYIYEKYRYWLMRYIMNIKPIVRKDKLANIDIDQIYNKREIKDKLLDNIENILVKFYYGLVMDITNIKTLNINDYSSLLKFYKKVNRVVNSMLLSNDDIIYINKYLKYIGEMISINLNKDIINVQEDNSFPTEKDQLKSYIEIISPIYKIIESI